MEASEQQSLLYTQEQIVKPAVEVLNNVTITPQEYKPPGITSGLNQALDDLFPEQQYDERDIQKAKEILGMKANEFTEVELKETISEIKYLAESWLDDFERKIFKKKTLNEMLHEKGGL